MRRTFHALAFTFVLVCACTGRQVESFHPIQYVTDIINRTQDNLEECEILDSCGCERPNVSGKIVIVDNLERCSLLTEAFLRSDSFDNVDAAPKSDMIPDFLGETFQTLVEDRVYPDASEASRTASVEDALTSLNIDAKLIVLSSQYLNAGRRDVDTMFTRFGIPVPVISTVDAMVSELLDSNSHKQPVSWDAIAVMASPAIAASGVYQEAVSRLISHGQCFMAYPDSTGSARSFLDNCLAQGMTSIAAILVDDYSVPVDSLRAECDAIIGSDTAEDLPYKSLLAGGITYVDPRSAVVSVCYKAMRDKNIFTHNIDLPAPCEVTYTLTDVYNFTPLVMDVSPKTTQDYVQDQHVSGGD